MRVQLEHKEQGAVAVIVALLATLLLGLAAFAVDFGQAYAVKRQLSVAADAAALDAARAVATTKIGDSPILGGGKGCATWTSAERSAAEDAAEDAAEATNATNDLSGNSVIDLVTVTCVGDDRVEVDVENSRELDALFAQLWGASGLEPERAATAAVIPRLSIGGLRPYAACNTVVTQAEAAPNSTFVMDLDNKIGVCNTSKPGDWGVVDFDGGANSADDTETWTGEGYPNPVIAPDSDLPADPGMPPPGKVEDELTDLLDQVVLFPVVTGYVETKGPGGNARFNLIGFVSAKVCGYRLNNQVDQGSCYDAAKAAPYNSAKVNFIQFRFVSYSAGYSGGGPTCDFSTPECRFAILGAQLYR